MRIPKYRQHSTRDVGFVEFQGKRYYFEGHYNSTSSLKAYRNFLKDHVLADPPERDDHSGNVTTIRTMMAGFLDECKATCSKQEYEAYRLACRVAAEHYRDLPAKDFGPATLKRMREHYFKARPVKRGKVLVEVKKRNSPQYVNMQVQRLRKAFKWAVSEELIPAWVHHGLMTISPLASAKVQKTGAEWDDVQLVLAEVSPTIAAMILVQWYTSARAKSVCNAKASQFTPSGDLWIWKPQHKRESADGELELPVGPKCQAILKPFIESAGDGYLFNPRTARNNRRYRDKYDTHSYRQSIDRAIERVNAKRAKEGLPPIRWKPHQLRHAKGDAVRQTYGIEAAQAILGHGSLEATQVYSARRLSLAKDVARETG